MLYRRAPLAGVLLVLAVCFPASGALAQEGRLLQDNWFALFLMGQKAGYFHEMVLEHETADGVQYETRVHHELSISRAQVPLRVTADETIWEDAEGHIVRFKQVVGGLMSQVREGRVEGDKLIVTGGTGFGSRTNEMPRQYGLCPHALSRLQREKGYAPGTEYTVSLFVPDAPAKAWTGNVKVVGEEAVPFFETSKRLTRVEVKLPELPALTSTEWHDAAGRMWAARLGMGGIEIMILRAPQEVATAQVAPAELMATTFARPDRPIRNPRQLDGLVLLMQPQKLTAEQLVIPADAHQRVEKRPDGVLISVRRAHGHPELSYQLPYDGDEFADQLQGNAWLERDDPEVRRMAAEAVGDTTDALTAAKRIEEYVDRAIAAKGLGVGMATAAETAVSRQGDCSEHAVLVAALARAAGIPSRIVGGLVYADTLPGMEGGAFGYHMWAEAWVGEWLPLDAAIRPHDATHIALARSDLNGPDDLFSISAAIMQIVGAVKLSVIDTTY
jgi:hypothetical protein